MMVTGGLYFPGETGESWWWQGSTSHLSPVSGLRTHLTSSLHLSSKSHSLPCPVQPAAQSNISRLRALNIKESWSGICPSIYIFSEYLFFHGKTSERVVDCSTTIQDTRFDYALSRMIYQYQNILIKTNVLYIFHQNFKFRKKRRSLKNYYFS